MIIAIGGKIGSGKNLVCNIIQYLTSEDSSSECIKRIRGGLSIEGYHNSKFEQKAFAGKLKQTASLLTGIPIEKFEDQEFKKTLLGSEWGTVKHNPLNAIPIFEDVEFNHLMSVRELLQKLGTEAMRDNLHENVWVNALFADYKAIVDKPAKFGGTSIGRYPSWCITDMRFPNEMDAIREREGITIRVVRPGTETGTHPSETSLDSAEFDYTIINYGTIEDLVDMVREILINEKII